MPIRTNASDRAHPDRTGKSCQFRGKLAI